MQDRQTFAGADAVRGFACFNVLFVHGIAINVPESNPYLTGCGKIGVWLFFVLSAFLLTHRFFEVGLNRSSLLSYALGRFLRIYPVYVVAVLLFYIFGTAGLEKPSDIWAALTLSGSYSHLWTVPVEFKAYFLLPIFVFGISFAMARLGFVAAMAMGVALIAVHQAIWPYSQLPENSVLVRWYLPAFMIGSLFAFIHRHGDLSRFLPWRIWIQIGIIIAVIVSTPAARSVLWGHVPNGDLMNKYLYFSLIWSVLIVVSVDRFLATDRFTILQRAFAQLGKISYSTYLFHWFFMIKIAAFAPRSVLAIVVSIVASIIFGAFMYWVLEAPLERFRKACMRR